MDYISYKKFIFRMQLIFVEEFTTILFDIRKPVDAGYTRISAPKSVLNVLCLDITKFRVLIYYKNGVHVL